MNVIELASIGLLSVIFVALLVMTWAAYRMVTYLHHYGAAAAAFMSPPDGETTSPLQALFSGVGMSSHMAELGTASGDARMELGARAQLIEAAARKVNPMVAQLADQMMPGWPRKVAKNPMLLTQAMEMFKPGGMLGGLLGNKGTTAPDQPSQRAMDFESDLESALGNVNGDPHG